MARTVGAKGKRSVGSVRVSDDHTLVPVNTSRMSALLRGQELKSLEKCGANRRQLRLLRDGGQAAMRFGKLKELAKLLDVPVAELLATSGPGETPDGYRVSVTARAVAEDCWSASGQPGKPPFWLTDLIRSLLSHDTWAGAFWDGGTPILSITAERGVRGRAKALARLEARRRQFCDQMAALIRLMLPTEADRKAGIRINPRRTGALLLAIRDETLSRMHRVSHRGNARTRQIAEQAARQVVENQLK